MFSVAVFLATYVCQRAHGIRFPSPVVASVVFPLLMHHALFSSVDSLFFSCHFLRVASGARHKLVAAFVSPAA